MRKSLNETKGIGETTPKPGIQENTSNEGAQMEKKKLIKCQKTKCHNDRYFYRTSECLELHERLQHQQGKEKIQEMKEKNYRAKFKQREHRCWGNPREDTCVNLYRVTNEDAPEEDIEYHDEESESDGSEQGDQQEARRFGHQVMGGLLWSLGGIHTKRLPY